MTGSWAPLPSPSSYTPANMLLGMKETPLNFALFLTCQIWMVRIWFLIGLAALCPLVIIAALSPWKFGHPFVCIHYCMVAFRATWFCPAHSTVFRIDWIWNGFLQGLRFALFCTLESILYSNTMALLCFYSNTMALLCCCKWAKKNSSFDQIRSYIGVRGVSNHQTNVLSMNYQIWHFCWQIFLLFKFFEPKKKN